MKVLVLALGGNRPAAVIGDAEYVLERGGEVIVATAMPSRFEELTARGAVVDLQEAEQRHPINRVERIMLVRAPKATFGRLAKIRGASRPARLGVGIFWTVHTRVWLRSYRRFLRPLLMAFVARHEVLALLARERFDQIVVGDAVSVPLGWHVARRYPDLPVGFALDRSTVAGKEVKEAAA